MAARAQNATPSDVLPIFLREKAKKYRDSPELNRDGYFLCIRKTALKSRALKAFLISRRSKAKRLEKTSKEQVKSDQSLNMIVNCEREFRRQKPEFRIKRTTFYDLLNGSPGQVGE